MSLQPFSGAQQHVMWCQGCTRVLLNCPHRAGTAVVVSSLYYQTAAKRAAAAVPAEKTDGPSQGV